MVQKGYGMLMQVIQIQADHVISTVFQETERGLLLIKGANQSYTSDQEMLAAIQNHATSLFDCEIRTLLALPPQAYHIKEVSLPIPDRAKLIEVLPAEINRDLGRTEPIVVDVLPNTQEGHLAIWADQAIVSSYLDVVRQAGIDPEVVTCSQLCWQHLLPEKNTESVALLDAYAITVIKDTQPVYCRVSLQPIDQSFLDNSLTVLTLTNQTEITQIYSVNGILPQVNVPPLPIPDDWYQSESFPIDAVSIYLSSYAVACSYHAEEAINLRRGSLRWQGNGSRLYGRYRLTLLLLSALILASLFYTGLAWYQAFRELNATETMITQVIQTALPGKVTKGEEYAQIQSKIKQLRSVVGTSDTLKFLTLLAQYKPSTILGISDIDFDGNKCILRGEAQNSEAVQQLLVQLTKNGWKMEQPEITSRPQQSVLFTIRGSKGGM